jgi:3-methyladenine DNA glycosylase Mpg
MSDMHQLTMCRRLNSINKSAIERSGTSRNVLIQLMNADRVAEDLALVWMEIQRAYSNLMVRDRTLRANNHTHGPLQLTTAIATETKVNHVRVCDPRRFHPHS